VDDTGGGVDIIFTDGNSASYDIVVGCDGIRSKIRAMTFPVPSRSLPAFAIGA
jgi:2-polyprenyl-6-methoxyphenol hydroxylase-like FAD-dependent oxidoreductase